MTAMVAAAGVAFTLAAAAHAGEACRPKALVIMLDGLRGDAVENLEMPHLQRLIAGKWQPGYKCAWSLGANTVRDGSTESAPNHVAIATGMTVKKTGISWNPDLLSRGTRLPTWLARLAKARPGTRPLHIFSWYGDLRMSPDYGVKFIFDRDDANAKELAGIVARDDAPDAIMWYIDRPDHAGHGFGYYPYTPEYRTALKVCDGEIGGVLNAIASRRTFAEEDWLVIVTADHGGWDRHHGQLTTQCYTIPFIVAGRHVAHGRIPGVPHNYDAAPTALAHFGVDISKIGFDGKVRGDVAAPAEKERELKDGLAVYLPFNGDAKVEMRGKAKLLAEGGRFGGALRVSASTNEAGCACLKGSEALKFENGAEFSFALWVRTFEKQVGDPVVLGNKDWSAGSKPGIALIAPDHVDMSRTSGYSCKVRGFNSHGFLLNCGREGRKRHDLGVYNPDFGEWIFYAATRGADGVVRLYQGRKDGYLYCVADDLSDIAFKTGLPFFIGQDGTGKYKHPFVGDVDDVAIWTRTLTHGEVQRIWEAGRRGVSLGGIVGASPLEIAVSGNAPAYTIVVPEKPGATEQFAAEELRDYVKRMTGVELPIAKSAEGRKAIFIRCEEAKVPCPADSFRIRADGGNLYITGGKRGVLYGVYEVLETYGGCRWYASWHTVVPKKDRFAVPGDLDDAQSPAFAMRESFWYDVNVNHDFAARLRVNGFNCTPGKVEAKLGDDDFRFGGGLGNCHTFERLLPQSVYFDKHPEYYSLVKGKRLRGRTQLCLTNPDVLRIVTSNVLERIRKDPGAKFYGVSQNDWYNYCECEKCAAVDKEEESHAGTMIRFVNAVAEAVEKEFPDAIIETLAYQYTRKPPKKTRVRHNVVPCLCTIECDFARPMDESPYAENISFRKDIETWKTQTDQLYLWDYVTEFQNYTLPFPNLLALQGNIKFFRDNNVKEIFAEGAQIGRHGAFAELKAWLLAKWMWNPELPMEPLLKDFLEGYYGAAAPFIRKYLDELHRRQRDWCADPRHPLRIWTSAAFRALDDEFIEWAKPLWKSAVDAVKDDPALSYNVRMSEFSFDFLRLERMNPKPMRKEVLFAPSPENDARIAETRALTKSLLDRMDEAKDICLSESRPRHDALIAGWRAYLDPVDAKPAVNAIKSQVAELEERYIRLARPGQWGAFVDDPKAADGKALKLFNTHFEWCATFSMGKVAFKPGAKYKIRARIRVEKERDGGEAFWAGVYDPVARKDASIILPRTDAIKDSEYAWYDVCTWTPREDGQEYFWIGPGRFGADGKSSIKAVYLDKVEISMAK
jgi:hypothetical protein